MSVVHNVIERYLISGTQAGVQAAMNLLYARIHNGILAGNVVAFAPSRNVINVFDPEELGEELMLVREATKAYENAPAFQKLAQGEKLERLCFALIEKLDNLK